MADDGGSCWAMIDRDVVMDHERTQLHISEETFVTAMYQEACAKSGRGRQARARARARYKAKLLKRPAGSP